MLFHIFLNKLIHYLFEGIILGFIISFSLGPVLVTIIETGLAYGSKMAVGIAIGVFSSDVLLISISRFFSSFLVDFLTGNLYIRMLAGLIFIAMGVQKLFAKRKTIFSKIDRANPSGILQSIAKGVFINSLNPGIIIFWLTLVGVYEQKEAGALFLFFSGVLITTLSFDIIKSIFAEKLIRFLSFKKLEIIKLVSAAIFIVSGIFILLHDFKISLDEITFTCLLNSPFTFPN